MEEKKEQKIRIGVNFETHETKFSDYVEVESTPDNVYLSFIQTLPGSPADQPNAKVVSRIALTWTHYARLSNLLISILERDRDMVKDSFEANISQGTKE